MRIRLLGMGTCLALAAATACGSDDNDGGSAGGAGSAGTAGAAGTGGAGGAAGTGGTAGSAGTGSTAGSGGQAGTGGTAGGSGTGGSAGAGGSSCGWELLGGQISADDAESEDPSMMVVGSTPMVGYRHGSFDVLLQGWNGSAWTASPADPSGGRCVASIYRAPDYCTDGQNVYVAYAHAGDGGANDDTFYDRVFLMRWTQGEGWEPMNGGAEVSQPWDPVSQVGYDADDASVACRAGFDPVVSWIEIDQTAAQSWDTFLASVTASSVTRSQRINRVALQITDARVTDAAIDTSGRAYVAFFEHSQDASFRTGLYVNAFDGTSLGAEIDHDTDSNRLSAPSLVAVGDDDVTLAWSADRDGTGSRHIYVSHWNGSAWSPVGPQPVSALGASHVDAGNPDLLLVNGMPTLAWDEQDDEGTYVYVAQFDGTTWNVLCDRVNVDPARAALDPSIAYDAATNTLYVTFEEYVSGWPQIFAKRLVLP